MKYLVKNKEIDKSFDIQEMFMDEYYDYDDIAENIDIYLKDYNKYLVFAYGCNWRGSNGYKIANSFMDTIYRDYDVAQYVKAITRGNKAMLIKEASHDVPMGCPVVIIGLTDTEAERLEFAEFEAIEEFANRYLEKLKEVA